MHILLNKEGLPNCDHQKLYISVDLHVDQKGHRIMHYLARKIQHFLRLYFDRKETEIVQWFPQNTFF